MNTTGLSLEAAQKSYYQVLPPCRKTMPGPEELLPDTLPTTTYILARPGTILRDYFRDFFLAGLWVGSNHYFLVMPLLFSFKGLPEL